MKQENLKENIQESFDITLIDSNLESIAENITELSIDCLLKDGTLKDIPIVGMISGLIKFGVNIHDKLFLKKIVSFLKELKDVPADDRKRMIDEIDSSDSYRIKVGEKLLYIIDNCNDYENSELVAHAFKFFLQRKINYNDFLKCSSVIEKITKYDFDWFLSNEDGVSIEDVPGSLIGTGLLGMQYEAGEISVSENSHNFLDPGSKYGAHVEGAGIKVCITEIGELILNIFKSE